MEALPGIFGRFRHQLRLMPSVFFRSELSFRGVEWFSPLHLVGRPWFSLAQGSRIFLGPGVTLDSSRRANPLGGTTPCIFRTLTPRAEIRIGGGSGISTSSLVAGNCIEIGEETLVGAGCLILDNDLHGLAAGGGWQNECSKNSSPIKIGRRCFIGTRAIILKGVILGDGVVVGAGAVVTKSFGSHAIVAGNPARQVNSLPQI